MSAVERTPGAVVIVGGGLAGASAAAALREEGYDGRLVLVGAEPHPPYERPPLSKDYLMGKAGFDDALAEPADFYESQGIDLRLGSPATALDLTARTVTVAGEELGYDRLLLATGSQARRLPGAEGPVLTLRTVDDSDRLKAALEPGRRVLIVGGGWIGLEVAAAARTAGCEVLVVEPLPVPLHRVLGPEVGEIFAALHREHGVELLTSTGVESVGRAPSGEEAVVRLSDGSERQADLVVVGIGAAPDTGLAEAAGLEVKDGVHADEHLRTGNPDVYVAGDIARAYHPLLGRTVRVEHWDNAKKQGATAARNMLGAEEPYDRLPYFFTDQYDLGMEYVGHVGDGYDEVVLRGDPSGYAFTAFWVADGRVVAAMHANLWDATSHLRRIVTTGAVDLAALRDEERSLEELG